MTISTGVLTLFFIIYCLSYNLFLFVYSLWRRPASVGDASVFDPIELPYLTIMIPALNEAKVLRRTVQNLLSRPYTKPIEILIINDHSDDETGEIADELARENPHIYVLHRRLENARQGKGAALNHGLYYLFEKFPERDRRRWVISVFDGDGRPVEEDFFIAAAKLFLDSSVAAAQSGVRIHNTHKLLPALQDTEFVAFSSIVQTARDETSGAVALGGNGQFIRADYLEQLSENGPWDHTALTEDLDITIRIHLLGGRIRFLERHVAQEGVESWKALLKQRQRWAWGSLQVFMRYVWSGELAAAEMPLGKKLDLHYYLSFWIVPFVVLFSFGLTLASLVLPLRCEGHFHWALLLANSFSFWPMMAIGLWKARVRPSWIPMLVVVGTLYSYHWVPALIRAWVNIARNRKPHWVKTQRVHN
jgi:cellulose synthase/poly-beta-1,6-N-acetylglucosamine synthase-like glycosyltransferase